jgi:hypothetical protein
VPHDPRLEGGSVSVGDVGFFEHATLSAITTTVVNSRRERDGNLVIGGRFDLREFGCGLVKNGNSSRAGFMMTILTNFARKTR